MESVHTVTPAGSEIGVKSNAPMAPTVKTVPLSAMTATMGNVTLKLGSAFAVQDHMVHTAT